MRANGLASPPKAREGDGQTDGRTLTAQRSPLRAEDTPRARRQASALPASLALGEQVKLSPGSPSDLCMQPRSQTQQGRGAAEPGPPGPLTAARTHEAAHARPGPH